MKNSRKNAAQSLYQVAESQQGYFTASQAVHAGIGDSAHSYHVKSGNWIREWRGIYRLAQFPESEDSYRVLWALWSQSRDETVQGVYSHQTALDIHKLSDINPSKLHMTVPRNFRRTASPPDVLVLHKANLADSEWEQMWGYQVTTPARTIADVLEEEKVSLEHVGAALKQAVANGMITPTELATLASNNCYGETVSRLLGDNH
jgi:predicted transcriptional regulator of viral defense system